MAVVMFACLGCRFGSSFWYYTCPRCGADGRMRAIPSSDVHAVDPAAPQIARLDSVAGLDNDRRLASGVDAWDATLGGGQPEGTVAVLGGDPGLGKSTLALQIIAGIAPRARTLYVSSEEPMERLVRRAARIGLDVASLFAVAEQLLPEIERALLHWRPTFAVVDSIQAVYDPGIGGHPGTVAQVKRTAWRLVKLAREINAALLVLAHVDKAGEFAGPMVVQHDVDLVAMLEGDPTEPLRTLRVRKNRFGPTTAVGRFEMTEEGLQ